LHCGRWRGLGALSLTVFLDFSRPRVCRFGEGQVRDAGAAEDGSKSQGNEDSTKNNDAAEKVQNASGQSAEHVTGGRDPRGKSCGRASSQVQDASWKVQSAQQRHTKGVASAAPII
jgi:hypothetical protein